MRIALDDGITLAPLAAADAVEYAGAAAADRERLARWFVWAKDRPDPENVGAFIATLHERRANGAGEEFAVRVNGAFAGAVGLHSVLRMHAVGALGYWLSSRFGGRGIMTRAVNAVAAYAFDDYALHRLEILAAVGNAPSRAVAERAGFAFEAMLRERLRAPNGYDDAALYVRLAPAPGSRGEQR
ncbi:MAG: ribosomal-protein-serine acetyltransferase [Candidatus Eremiobacteraeota bacterium]|jgi:ribosomal-protein-serine acetyltransferase|nr:ribosomal-protein-serine acetyltransferase [Candidatus Eremiobacteraeota bacterium]